MKRSGPPERRTPLKRGGPLRASPRRAMAAKERRLAERWHRGVIGEADHRCVMCGAGRTVQIQLTAHHIIPKQTLKREGHHDRLWDLDNGLCLCWPCHANHEAAHHRVPRYLIPDAAVRFAQELGLEWALLAYPDRPSSTVH